MEILWILLGLVTGILLAWYFLGTRYRAELAEQESSWAERLRKEEAQAAEQRSLHEVTKTALGESLSREATARQQATALESQFADSRQALGQARAEASEASGELAAARSETGDLRSKLAAGAAARSALEEKMLAQKEAGAAAAAASDDSAARLRRLQSELTTRDQKIAALQAEPAHMKQRETGPPRPAASEPAQGYHPGEVKEVVDLDDLTRIKGIGPVLQEKLQRMGITGFRQIAELTTADIQRVDGVLDFPGRIEREKWVEQARNLTRR